MRTFFLLLFLSFTAHFSFAQGGSVSGNLVDKTSNQPVSFAQVLLVSLPDSSLKAAQTDLEGRFQFPNVSSGRYLVRVSYLGYKPFRREVQVAGAPVNLGNLAIEEDAKRLKEVEVVGRAAMSVQKGDTTEFDARAFKTNPDASAEDMVQKVPGVTMQNGKVQAQGEEVRKVLLDGREFFGEDASAALRNLPAEVISKIQILDEKSEQSQFSGVDDGNTIKTINIITKPDMRSGKFGKVYAGAGTDDRYMAGGNLNLMNGARRISLIGQTNNVNQQNFSTADLLGVTGGGGGRGGRGGPGGFGGGGGASDFQVNTRNGIARTHAFGINYADEWGKKVKVTGSYFLNLSDNVAAQRIFRQYPLPEDSAQTSTEKAGQIYNENSVADASNINHRFNLRLDWDIDSMNSIRWRPRFTLQQNDGNSFTISETQQLNQLLNRITSNLNTDMAGYTFSNDLLYRRKFAKRGRTFSARFTTDFSGNNGERFLLSEGDRMLNQFSELATNGPTYESELSYSEPLGKNSSLSADYRISLRRNEADQKTYDFDETTRSYSRFNTGLSNVFNSDYITQATGLGYRYNLGRDLVFMTRLNYQHATLTSEQEFPFQTDVKRTFNNLLPFAMLRYNFNKDKNIRVFYRTSTNPPSISQLQNVIDNTNPSLLRTGNPDLRQDYRHRLVTRYSAAKPEKSTTFFAMLHGEVAQNYVANSSLIARRDTLLPNGIFLPEGVQLNRPVNLDGYYSLRSFATYGMPIGGIKSNLNLNGSAGFTRAPGLVNGQQNFANTQSYGLGVVLSSNISENLDFTISANPTYNLVKNTLQSRTDNNYFNQNSGLRLNWIIWNGLFVQSDITHQYYSGLSAGIEQNYLLWNAAVGKKLFKNNRGEIKLTAFDLLNQNTSIQRNITETYVEDVQTNVLQRYFMLMFTYNIRSFGSSNAAPAAEPGMPPGGMPGRPYRN